MAKNINIVSKEYIALQQSFIDKQVAWREKFKQSDAQVKIIEKEIPFILQGKLKYETKVAFEFMLEILENLKTVSPDTTEDVEKVLANLDEKTVSNWIKQAVAINIPYFERVAKKYKVATYLPHFVTEQVLRPILFNVSQNNSEAIETVFPVGVCKCCGEPNRLADLDAEGRKQIVCPRCNTTWYVKKLTCISCNTDNHKDIVVVKLEANTHEQIHICKKCHSYAKVVSSKRMIDPVEPAMLDLLTIHLDFIAQEKVENDEVLSN